MDRAPIHSGVLFSDNMGVSGCQTNAVMHRDDDFDQALAFAEGRCIYDEMQSNSRTFIALSSVVCRKCRRLRI